MHCTLYLSRCTTTFDEKHIAVTDTHHFAILRTILQNILPVTQQLASAPTIRRRLQKSGLFARRPLLRLPLNRNQKPLLRQGSDEQL